MEMDLKTVYLFILGITITILTHTIFKTRAPIKEGFFAAIAKLVRDIQNIICFIRWFVEFMRWAIESLICLFKYINPLCVFFAIFDIIIAAIAWLLGHVLKAMGLEWVNIGFQFGLDGIDRIAEKLSGSKLFKYPDILNTMCYSCVITEPPPPPTPF